MEDPFTTKSRPLTYPFCEAHELQPFGPNAARCEYCGGILAGALLHTLSSITRPPDAAGRHAWMCEHSLRSIPDR